MHVAYFSQSDDVAIAASVPIAPCNLGQVEAIATSECVSKGKTILLLFMGTSERSGSLQKTGYALR